MNNKRIDYDMNTSKDVLSKVYELAKKMTRFGTSENEDYRKTRLELNDYLMQFSDEDVHNIFVIMYIGRGYINSEYDKNHSRRKFGIYIILQCVPMKRAFK